MMWSDLYSLLQRDTDDALDLLYDRVDRLLTAGDFSAVETAIDALDPTRLDVVTALGVLTITLPVAERLPLRSKFADRVRALDPGRADDLLAGLS